MIQTAAQKRADVNYRKNNPHRVGYRTLVRNAKIFIKPKVGSASEQHIKYVDEEGIFSYVDDLKELELMIHERLKELGEK